jgi:hypothetical protein
MATKHTKFTLKRPGAEINFHINLAEESQISVVEVDEL